MFCLSKVFLQENTLNIQVKKKNFVWVSVCVRVWYVTSVA